MSDFEKRLAALSPAAAAKLRQRLQQAPTTTRPTITAYPRTSDTLPLSFAQQRLWFLDQIDPANVAYNVPLILRLQGTLDLSALERALNAIVARHESLRTTFIMRDGQPRQRIASSLALPLVETSLRHVAPDDRTTAVQRWMNERALEPFDLAAGPLVRWEVATLDDSHHVLLIVIHHIVSDGWSLGPITQELTAFYESFVGQHPARVPDLSIQVGDYALWQRERFHDPAFQEKQLKYWTTSLAGAPPTLDLPTDFPRPPTTTHAGKRFMVALPDALHHALLELSQREKVTLFMAALTAFKVLLYRYTGQTDLLVGTPIAGRAYKETEPLIGLFLNTLVLRTDLSGNPTFTELLAKVRDVALNGYSNQEVPFEKIIEVLAPERNLSYSPLFQVMFSMETQPKLIELPSGLSVEAILPQFDTAKFDLTLALIQQGGRAEFAFEYKTQLFRDDTIRRMAGHYLTLLDAIVQHPNTKISDLPLLTQDEIIAFEEWNATQQTYPHVPTLHALVEAQAAQAPDAVAVEANGERLTYGNLNHRANALAQELVAMGVKPDTLVGVYMDRSAGLLVALLAVLKAGGAYVPLDPSYPTERITTMLEDAAPVAVLTNATLHDSLPTTSVPVLEVPPLSSPVLPSNTPQVEVTGDNLAYVIYTSGSTGKPKGVQIPHRAVVNFLQAMQVRPGIKANDTLVAVTTFAFDISILELFLPLTVGAKVVLASREVASDGAQLGQLLASSGATMMQATPAGWRLLLASGWQGQSNLKMLCGGEALPVDVAEALLEKGGSLWNMYGPTEATIWTTMVRIMSPDDITIGKPLPNTTAYVLDTNLKRVPVGVVGDLYIGGVGLARGYRNRPDLTSERFVPNTSPPRPLSIVERGSTADVFVASAVLSQSRNTLSHPLPDAERGSTTDVSLLPQSENTIGLPLSIMERGQGGEVSRLYKTGDKARFRADGSLLFLGRDDGQVKLRGYRIELGEIESVLARHPNVTAAVVVLHEIRANDPALVAYVIPKGDAPTEELKRFLRQTLPEYMIPTFFLKLNHFPLSPAGKVDRKALPAPTEPAPEPSTFVAPDSMVETAVEEIWVALLQRESIGIHDDFFAIGGHSLLATQVIARLNETFDMELPVRVLFEAPTIARLAMVVEQTLFDEIEALDEAEAQQALLGEE